MPNTKHEYGLEREGRVCYKIPMSTLDEITRRLTDLLDGTEGFDAAVLFDCGEAGVIHIDGTSGVVKVSAQEGNHDCRIAMSAETFLHILDGEMDETAAFMQGEMRLTGEIGLATQVSDFIRVTAQAEDASAA